jgi:hypothetical protein
MIATGRPLRRRSNTTTGLWNPQALRELGTSPTRLLCSQDSEGTLRTVGDEGKEVGALRASRDHGTVGPRGCPEPGVDPQSGQAPACHGIPHIQGVVLADGREQAVIADSKALDPLTVAGESMQALPGHGIPDPYRSDVVG